MKFIEGAAIVGALQLGLFSLSAQQTNTTRHLPPVTVEGTAPSVIPQSDSSATTEVSGGDVREGEITAVCDLSAQEPNLAVFDGNNERSPKFSIRGLRENSFGVGEPVVGMYVDDVPYFDVNSRGLSLYDVQSIEFARGAQGTVCGAGGVGGVMNVNTKQPGNDWHGDTSLSYGDYDTLDTQLGLRGALIKNQLYLSVGGMYGYRDGYVNNVFLGDHPDTRENLSGRAELLWTPGEPWKIALSAAEETFHDGFVPTYRPGPFSATSPFLPFPTSPPDPGAFSVARDLDGYVNTADDSQALKVSFAPSSVVVTSVTTHRDWKQNLLQDFDFSANPDYQVDGFTKPRMEQWGEEIRAMSPESADKFKWLGGFYFLDNEMRNNSGSMTTYFGSPLPATPSLTDSYGQTYAAFGQGTYTVLEKLDLTAGMRLTIDERSIDGTVVNTDPTSPAYGGPLAINASQQFTALQPKFAAAWHFTPQAEVYASASEGYQSGGFNAFINNTAYQPARSWEYEVGGKTSWLDRRLTANAALFYTDTEGYQVIRINPANPLAANLLNAHRAVSYGAELELGAKPVTNLDLSVVAGYTCAKYENFLDASSGLQLSGQPVSFVPEFTANLSAKYRLPWHTYAKAEITAIGRYHLDDTGLPIPNGPTVQDTYELVNVQLGYEQGHFGAYFFARNVFDRHYFNDALNFGAGTGTSSLILQPGDPGTFGFAATAKF